jgi:hypothetical protein
MQQTFISNNLKHHWQKENMINDACNWYVAFSSCTNFLELCKVDINHR